MKITPEIIDGRAYLRIEADTFAEVQREINRMHGRFKFEGPNKFAGKYIALGMEESDVRGR